MRLFTGIPIPDQVKQSLELLLERLRPTARLKWSPIHNLHITTKFIGEWPADRLDEMKTVLATVAVQGPVRIEISGLGWFPNPHQPRVFWAGIRAPRTLADLAHATEQALVPLGLAPEDRAFSPHLTLARVRETDRVAGVREAVAKLDAIDFGWFEASDFHLYLSELGPAGSAYTSLATYPLSQ